ncbi:MAG: virulence factor [Parvibaculaceae bacterium]
MAECTIVSWQEIPSMVEAREGRARHKLQLSDRFQELIDMIAMRRGLSDSDAYMGEWRRERTERPGAPEAAAAALAAEIEGRYEEIRAEAIRLTKEA